MRNKKSFWAFIISCLFILSIVFYFSEWKNNTTVRWDIAGYYSYLPATFIYKDIKKLEWIPTVQEKYYVPGLEMAGFQDEESKNKVMKYPLGMSIAYSPWFFSAHLYSKLTSHEANGFSKPYHFFVAIGCLIYAFIGLWFFRKILLKYFSDSVSAIVLLLITVGTNYLNYTAFDMAMPHNFLFTLYAILIWNTIKWYEKPTWKNSIIIGICIGWAALSRPTEIISALIPILWGIYNLKSLRDRFLLWKKEYPKILLTIGIVAIIGSLQLLYWKYATGNFIVYSYEDQGFTWNGVHLKNCFFSYRKGWLVYTPLMAFSLIGFVFLFIKNRKLFPSIFIFFLINTYIIFSWDIWWYGGGFGQRAMIPSYVLLGLSFAALIEWIWNKKIIAFFIGIGILFSTWLNLHQTWQAHYPGGGFETEAMTKAYYWKIFGKTKTNPEWRILLDTDEVYDGQAKNISTIYSNDFESKTDSIFFNKKYKKSGEQALYMNNENQYSPIFSAAFPSESKGDWIRATANFYCENREGNYWSMNQFIISLEQENNVVKHKMIRIHRVLVNKKWRSYSIDIKIPKDKKFDNVKVKFWNANGTRELWIDDLKIDVLETE